jgi:hypothetical protein
VLLAKLAGAMAAPMVQLAGLLEALPRSFAYGLKALIDQGGGVPAEAEAPAAEPDAAQEAPTEEPAAATEAAEAAETTDTTDAPAEEAPAAEPEAEATPETTEE